MKKVIKFISSMRFAIILLILLVVACGISSLVTQGQTFEWYSARYSERMAALIFTLGLDDAYHSYWFIAISAALCISLLACNLIHMPALIKRVRADRLTADEGSADVSGDFTGDVNAVFERMHMPKPTSVAAESGDVLIANKNGIGHWGAWICHLGILLLILGFGLGQATQRQYTVYGVPGQLKPIEDTGYVLGIDSFDVERAADGSVMQYKTDVTVYDIGRSGSTAQGSVSVNNPATLFGMKLYQNSTGWAADIDISENDEPLQSETLCAGESVAVADKPELVITLNAVYPDYVRTADGRPATASDEPNNPAYLYSVYYQNQIIGMNVLMQGEPLTIDEYTVYISAPQPYTLIQIKVDRMTPLALAGGILIMIGLFLALYVQPKRVWAVKTGESTWRVCGRCRKSGVLFKEEFEAALERDAV